MRFCNETGRGSRWRQRSPKRPRNPRAVHSVVADHKLSSPWLTAFGAASKHHFHIQGSRPQRCLCQPSRSAARGSLAGRFEMLWVNVALPQLKTSGLQFQFFPAADWVPFADQKSRYYFGQARNGERNGFVKVQYKARRTRWSPHRSRVEYGSLSTRPLVIVYPRDCTPEDDGFWPEIGIICDFARAITERDMVGQHKPPREYLHR